MSEPDVLAGLSKEEAYERGWRQGARRARARCVRIVANHPLYPNSPGVKQEWLKERIIARIRKPG